MGPLFCGTAFQEDNSSIAIHCSSLGLTVVFFISYDGLPRIAIEPFTWEHCRKKIYIYISRVPKYPRELCKYMYNSKED